MLAIERMMQTQAMCLRLIVVVGEERADYAIHFDLVGSHSRSEGNSRAFYDDIILRLATSVSAHDVAKHVVVPPVIARATWLSLSTPPAMRQASLEFAKRSFFTEMVRIADLNTVPALGDAIASQYSEGCFATWEPGLSALVATTTGSARPVDKRNITDDELAVITGVQPDEEGSAVQNVEGKRNDPPSSEAFEMIDMDRALPTVVLATQGGATSGPGTSGGKDPLPRVPVIRSKLHGHRGVSAYDPRCVEYAPMAPEYFWYPVTCGTLGQAIGVKEAFARSAALQNPDDPRQVVFTILPGHGVFIVEKWAAGKAPFEVIWEYMDAGYLRIDTRVPQGPEFFAPAQVGGTTVNERGE
jgi:hypothetical protein